MVFDILTIFPDFFLSPLQEGIVRRARTARKISVDVHDIRGYALDRHRMTDDRPFGGGEGMVMKPEPLARCLQAIAVDHDRSSIILLSPRGRQLNQETAQRLSQYSRLILVCGRYEGVDERFRDRYVDEELSIGDYVLTGGELAALVVIDAVTRLLPGVLGCSASVDHDSFSRGLLKHGQFTRPRIFEGVPVPDVLLSGDHRAIATYRLIESVRITMDRRPDLLATARFTADEQRILKKEGLLEQVEAIVQESRSKLSHPG
ncbi:tRNA (guanosine(37)-N1)-methyltransferase TrmD [Desulfobulbus alkaliphilus]|uniref:tRNA (guanosine(37)-N1)-methyltransferase TrmD n=1 Tax=Desulfobulbus alkaliphilus TaxID=869814 RepID=UPI00196251D6|nr:tRNA (guanosine(37)-N1)-methyltransferase TrmD [Desulfobulbus alkaliphilus]MBM9536415.1 tRNA (guanosine(37)-N1)-methyltransferase TrmD [Desulfobulbus alkaliphilus]